MAASLAFFLVSAGLALLLAGLSMIPAVKRAVVNQEEGKPTP